MQDAQRIGGQGGPGESKAERPNESDPTGESVSSAGVTLIDLASPLYRLAVSGNFEHYVPIADPAELRSLRELLGE